LTISRQSPHQVRRIRAELHAADPRRYWCRTVTHTTDGATDANAATVDHVKPRRECRSQEEYESSDNHVLACFECNQERDRVDLALMRHQQRKERKLEELRNTKRRVLVRTKYLR
jgi:hypothetical protein